MKLSILMSKVKNNDATQLLIKATITGYHCFGNSSCSP